MGFVQRKIVVIQVRRPKKLSVNDELQWLGHSLGLFGERDRDKSCFRVFLELVKATKQQQALSSDELGHRLQLSRPTIVHHLHELLDRGMVIEERRRYILRAESLQHLLSDIHSDMEQTMAELNKAAKELDEVLRL